MVSKVIDVLVVDVNGFSVGFRLYLDNECVDFRLYEVFDNSEGFRDIKFIYVILVWLSMF